MTVWDCVIVGAGPGGASAAYALAKKGRSVLLLDRAKLPRYKPCGGGVSPQIAQWFDFDFSPVISTKVTQLCYTWKMEDTVTADLPQDKAIWMVRREDFDFFMVQQAQRRGAQLQDETKVQGVQFQGETWSLETSQGTLQARYLIAADGATGKMAEWLGFRNRKFVLAGAIEIEPKLTPANAHQAYFEFGLLKNGYVWNFPKVDGYSIGSGIFRTGKRQPGDLRSSMQVYAAQFGVDSTQVKVCGHPICIWNGDQSLHTQRALLAGEAAGVVDPLTAEGIRPAIFSGLKAGEAIEAALDGDPHALPRYSEIIAQEWGTQMRWAQRIAWLMYSFPQLAYQVVIKHPTGSDRMVEIFAGELAYGDVVERVVQKFKSKLGAVSFPGI